MEITYLVARKDCGASISQKNIFWRSVFFYSRVPHGLRNFMFAKRTNRGAMCTPKFFSAKFVVLPLISHTVH